MAEAIKVKFYIENRTNKKTKEIREKNIPILFSVCFGGRYLSTTGLRIDKNLWDIPKHRVKPSHSNATRYNKYLSDLKKELEDICLDARQKGIRLNSGYISANLTMNKLKSKTGFFDIYDNFIKDAENKCTPGTITKYTTIKNHLEDFATKQQYKIEFDTLNEVFLSKFLDYYFDDKKFINSYVRKNLSFIRTFLTWAEKQGFNKNDNYKEWKLDTGQKNQNSDHNIISLSISEFLKIYKYKPELDSLQRAKDYLILACSTGLRFSDIQALRKTDINYNHGMIRCTTIKTGDYTEIPFNQFSKEILDKYKDSPNYSTKGIEMAFPVISNQKTNEALKTLGEKAGITDNVTVTHYVRNKRIDEVFKKYQLIGTHIGRKTFITFNVGFGVVSEVTMALTTHKRHETMEKYYTVGFDMKKRAMQQFSIDNLETFVTDSVN